ncbi:hypothetical protein DM02DRAFT_634197 [Periconia macrospinosa]|uniref:Uncharacterized protein n=1 Tax=Periconia macrospinosa TaxID=97972 RepID=A0A2V1D6W9_9PLEO|nr:hypothetical protein DM02DRAFT_634197 [Periconia macrospinosa]
MPPSPLASSAPSTAIQTLPQHGRYFYHTTPPLPSHLPSTSHPPPPLPRLTLIKSIENNANGNTEGNALDGGEKSAIAIGVVMALVVLAAGVWMVWWGVKKVKGMRWRISVG